MDEKPILPIRGGAVNQKEFPRTARCVSCFEETSERLQHNIKELLKFYKNREFIPLKCSHFVCSRICLEKLKKGGGVGGVEPPSECAECHIQFKYSPEMLMQGIKLLETLEMVESPSVKIPKRCDACIRPYAVSSRYCMTCLLSLCVDCIENHKAIPETMSHYLVTSPNLTYTVAQNEICSVHRNQKLTTFCETCDKELCDVCVHQEEEEGGGGGHVQHKIENLSDYVTKAHQDLRFMGLSHTKLIEACNKMHRQSKMLESERRIQTKMLTNELNETYKKLIKAAKQRGRDLQEDIVVGVTMRTFRLNSQKSCLNSLIGQANHVLEFPKKFSEMVRHGGESKAVFIHRVYSQFKKQIIHLTKKSNLIVKEPYPKPNVNLESCQRVYDDIEKMLKITWELDTSSIQEAAATRSQSLDSRVTIREEEEERNGNNVELNEPQVSSESEEDDSIVGNAIIIEYDTDEEELSKVIKTEPLTHPDSDRDEALEEEEAPEVPSVIKREIIMDEYGNLELLPIPPPPQINGIFRPPPSRKLSKEAQAQRRSAAAKKRKLKQARKRQKQVASLLTIKPEIPEEILMISDDNLNISDLLFNEMRPKDSDQVSEISARSTVLEAFKGFSEIPSIYDEEEEEDDDEEFFKNWDGEKGLIENMWENGDEGIVDPETGLILDKQVIIKKIQDVEEVLGKDTNELNGIIAKAKFLLAPEKIPPTAIPVLSPTKVTSSKDVHILSPEKTAAAPTSSVTKASTLSLPLPPTEITIHLTSPVPPPSPQKQTVYSPRPILVKKPTIISPSVQNTKRVRLPSSSLQATPTPKKRPRIPSPKRIITPTTSVIVAPTRKRGSSGSLPPTAKGSRLGRKKILASVEIQTEEECENNSISVHEAAEESVLPGGGVSVIKKNINITIKKEQVSPGSRSKFSDRISDPPRLQNGGVSVYKTASEIVAAQKKAAAVVSPTADKEVAEITENHVVDQEANYENGLINSPPSSSYTEVLNVTKINNVPSPNPLTNGVHEDPHLFTNKSQLLIEKVPATGSQLIIEKVSTNGETRPTVLCGLSGNESLQQVALIKGKKRRLNSTIEVSGKEDNNEEEGDDDRKDTDYRPSSTIVLSSEGRTTQERERRSVKRDDTLDDAAVEELLNNEEDETDKAWRSIIKEKNKPKPSKFIPLPVPKQEPEMTLDDEVPPPGFTLPSPPPSEEAHHSSPSAPQKKKRRKHKKHQVAPEAAQSPSKRGRGRPPGAKNKPKNYDKNEQEEASPVRGMSPPNDIIIKKKKRGRPKGYSPKKARLQKELQAATANYFENHNQAVNEIPGTSSSTMNPPPLTIEGATIEVTTENFSTIENNQEEAPEDSSTTMSLSPSDKVGRKKRRRKMKKKKEVIKGKVGRPRGKDWEKNYFNKQKYLLRQSSSPVKENTPSPFKRKPGRPPKYPHPLQESQIFPALSTITTEQIPLAASTGVEIPVEPVASTSGNFWPKLVKGKPGRPFKNSSPRRRPGRPPKIKSPWPGRAKDGSPGRGPGRPPKISKESAVNENPLPSNVQESSSVLNLAPIPLAVPLAVPSTLESINSVTTNVSEFPPNAQEALAPSPVPVLGPANTETTKESFLSLLKLTPKVTWSIPPLAVAPTTETISSPKLVTQQEEPPKNQEMSSSSSVQKSSPIPSTSESIISKAGPGLAPTIQEAHKEMSYASALKLRLTVTPSIPSALVSTKESKTSKHRRPHKDQSPARHSKKAPKESLPLSLQKSLPIINSSLSLSYTIPKTNGISPKLHQNRVESSPFPVYGGTPPIQNNFPRIRGPVARPSKSHSPLGPPPPPRPSRIVSPMESASSLLLKSNSIPFTSSDIPNNYTNGPPPAGRFIPSSSSLLFSAVPKSSVHVPTTKWVSNGPTRNSLPGPHPPKVHSNVSPRIQQNQIEAASILFPTVVRPPKIYSNGPPVRPINSQVQSPHTPISPHFPVPSKTSQVTLASPKWTSVQPLPSSSTLILKTTPLPPAVIPPRVPSPTILQNGSSSNTSL